MEIDKSKDELFWKKIILNSESGCIEWIGFKGKDGYGYVFRIGHRWSAHKWAWLLYKGKIPEDKCILHRCDNKNCVNINHLFIGTHTDNMVDMSLKGRGVYPCAFKRGENHPDSKLSEEKVKIIRALYPSISAKNLAFLFGLDSHISIYNIIKRKSWKNIKSLSQEEVLKIRLEWASQYT